MHSPHVAAEDGAGSIWDDFEASFMKAQEVDDETQLCVEQVCDDRIRAISHVLLPMAKSILEVVEQEKDRALFALCLAMISLPHHHLNLHPFAMVLHP